MTSKPLISIVIPTYNSEKTLPLTLASIRKQTYKNIEVIVVDSYSTDRTVEIARRFGARVMQTHGGLLWARYLGHLHAKGEIELLLDSDQILHPTTIERAVKMMTLRGCDALILEETSFKPKTLIQWLFYLDRKYVHEIKDLHPVHGVLLARIYKHEILDKAFKNIKARLPPKIMLGLVSQDHAIIYYEVWNHIERICVLRDAVYHIEPASLKQLIKKFYRYGKTELLLSKYYPELVKGKRTPRKPSLRPESMPAMLLWLLKAIPYMLGRIATNLSIVWLRNKQV